MLRISHTLASPMNYINSLLIPGHGNTHAPSPALSVPDHLLNDDLQLSESGSDSD